MCNLQKAFSLRTIKICQFEIIDGVKYVYCIKHAYKVLLREQVGFAAVLWPLRQCVSCSYWYEDTSNTKCSTNSKYFWKVIDLVQMNSDFESISRDWGLEVTVGIIRKYTHTTQKKCIYQTSDPHSKVTINCQCELINYPGQTTTVLTNDGLKTNCMTK